MFFSRLLEFVCRKSNRGPAGLISENIKQLKADVMAVIGAQMASQTLALEDADNMLEEVVSDEDLEQSSPSKRKPKKRKKPTLAKSN